MAANTTSAKDLVVYHIHATEETQLPLVRWLHHLGHRAESYGAHSVFILVERGQLESVLRAAHHYVVGYLHALEQVVHMQVVELKQALTEGRGYLKESGWTVENNN